MARAVAAGEEVGHGERLATLPTRGAILLDRVTGPSDPSAFGTESGSWIAVSTRLVPEQCALSKTSIPDTRIGKRRGDLQRLYTTALPAI